MTHTTRPFNPASPTPVDGTCRECGLRRTVFKITRRGGGTYRRAGRSYRSSICGDCAVNLHDNGWSSRFDRTGLARVAAYVKAQGARPASD